MSDLPILLLLICIMPFTIPDVLVVMLIRWIYRDDF